MILLCVVGGGAVLRDVVEETTRREEMWVGDHEERVDLLEAGRSYHTTGRLEVESAGVTDMRQDLPRAGTPEECELPGVVATEERTCR